MGIDTSTTVSITTTSSSLGTSSSQTPSVNSDSSFKNEMDKVSETSKTETNKTEEKKADLKESNTKEKQSVSKDSENIISSEKKDDSMNLNNPTVSLNPQMLLQDANNMLQNGIMDMINNTAGIEETNVKNWSIGFGSEGSQKNLKMTENDANFFLNLTQTNDLSAQNIVVQAQNMINNGADAKEISQNFQVSQTLLNALSEARQNNQPLRIDFDQNISVIIRVNKDGAISANFIPGDKAVEQYLKANIESLKNTFEEQDLNYTELSYSNSSKKQNQKRREKQGE